MSAPAASSSTRVLIWNVQWATPGSDRGNRIRSIIDERDPDLVCITEGYCEFLSDEGHCIEAEADYGYPAVEGRRKVLLWSREPWSAVDSVGDVALPPGRYVAGTTSTSAGELRLHGVCIPWRDAHVRTGRRNRTGWEDHLTYLEGLRRLLAARDGGLTLVLGDFNQRIPRSRVPKRVHEPLLSLLDEDFRIPTTGTIESVERQAIDHLAHTKGLEARSVRGIPDHTSDGTRLSDHFGLEVELVRCEHSGRTAGQEE